MALNVFQSDLEIATSLKHLLILDLIYMRGYKRKYFNQVFLVYLYHEVLGIHYA